MPQFTLLNTRPADQATALQQLVDQADGQALSCPSIEIEILKPKPSDLAELQHFDKLVFISANAVKAFVTLSAGKLKDSVQLFAIGQATFKVGSKAGLDMHTAEGERFDSEALLKHPDLQNLNGQKVLIVKGQGGRELLESSFVERGAQVSGWELYRRKPLPLCNEAWERFVESSQPIVLATSISGLESLMDAVTHSEKVSSKTQQAWSDWLRKQTLVVFSERIQIWALKQGWQGTIVIVPTQSDEGIMQSITTIVRKKES
ncbi:uroporphyrinogen-III synthase [Thiomicrorhabdus sp. ZW0627]|uniref:uroporphyrinogen-III synthase n=1 Tax=Thiomicrorhabdus sp. ZW0627 TaxID=3039774 RepID=UPI002437325B|nr:uroporphyrinogen-III synthase [Thiomicrorhabdus sp. ZW0627]MDG6774588.1 uroporphyrinogen-III synthase [Thiomicrorhabdus sp. ZW0627]